MNIDAKTVLRGLRMTGYLLVFPSALAGLLLVIFTTVGWGTVQNVVTLTPFEKYLCWVCGYSLIFYAVTHYTIFHRNKRWWHTQQELDTAVDYHEKKSRECEALAQELGLTLLEYQDKMKELQKDPENGDEIVS